MANPISLVVPDAGPLISLATADRLDLFHAFAVPVVTLDVVRGECLFKDWPGKTNLERWFGRNEGAIEIDRSGRTVAPYQADRPALVGANGRAKSSWKAALRTTRAR